MLKTCLGLMTGALVSSGSVIYILDRSVKATGTEAKPPSYPWAMEGILSSLDHESIRRGWHVYRSVCSTCHSLRYLYFKDLINVAYTETEMKAIAAEYEVDDGPDEEGNYYKRPGKPYDRVPPPFPNEEAARAANNGALPVDLTFVVNARRKGKDYVFSILTGYCEAPAGIALADGQLFNPYFPGGAISMPEVSDKTVLKAKFIKFSGPTIFAQKMIQDGIVEYEDGTPASRAQIAKDVVEFLTWTANQEWDARKIILAKGVGIGVLLYGIIGHMNRQKWAAVRSRQILYVPKRK